VSTVDSPKGLIVQKSDRPNSNPIPNHNTIPIPDPHNNTSPD